MEYSNFVKYYYRKVVELLKNTDDYAGTIVDLSYIPMCYKDIGLYMHELKDGDSPILGNMEINIDAPEEIFSDWLDYMFFKYPDIAEMFLGSAYLKILFDSLSKKDDETIMVVIDTMTECAFEECKEVL